MSRQEASFISIARITKTQGLKGAVRIEQLLEDDRIFEPGRRLRLTSGRFPERETEIEFFRRQHGRCVVKLRGIDAISDAEHYIGAEIQIPASELSPPKEGWFYTFQLKGCRVFAVDGEYIGTITDVLDSGGTEILKVDRENEETLIPFAESYLKKIDLDQRRIEVDLPEGLRELNK
ncbi:MAG: 16S rRNA processing protein RimM [Acidobacteria bacterium]|nr:MAG: 16S rRNA processing protein RimM [Acidobacteriota bacterium]